MTRTALEVAGPAIAGGFLGTSTRKRRFEQWPFCCAQLNPAPQQRGGCAFEACVGRSASCVGDRTFPAVSQLSGSPVEQSQ
jgi:hypothetical protein